MRKVILLIAVLMFPFAVSVHAAEREDDALSIWSTTVLRKSFGKENRWGVGVLQEYRHKIHEGVSKTDQWFMRPSVSYDALPWLKLQYQMDFASTSSGFNLRFMPEVTFSHKVGDFSLSFRQRAMTTWKVAAGTNTTVLRSRAKAEYHIRKTPLSIHVAAEPYWCEFSRNSFAWFQKCRWYAGLNIKLLDNLSVTPQYVCQAYHNGNGRYARRTYDDHVLYVTFLVKL